MEKECHSIVTERMREFKNLRRQYRTIQRQGGDMDMISFNKMLYLDEWLADNNPEWHQNYPELEKREEV